MLGGRLSEPEELEVALLALDDEEWGSMELERLTTSDGPPVTGDPEVDAWERDAWDEANG